MSNVFHLDDYRKPEDQALVEVKMREGVTLEVDDQVEMYDAYWKVAEIHGDWCYLQFVAAMQH